MSARPEVHRVVAGATAGIAGRRVGWGFISIYAAAYAGTWLALLTPIMVTLTLRASELAPQGAERWLSLTLSLGAIAALLGNPIAGWLSDRTTSRWGRRRPWLFAGALGGVTSLWLVSIAPTMGWLMVGWALAQLSFNAVLAPLAALLPDQVEPARRGTVAGIISITTPLGQVGGTFLTRAVAGDTTAMLMIPAAICAAVVLLLLAVLPDRRLAREQAAPLDRRALRALFHVDLRKSPDFAWVCGGRFFLMMCMAFLMAYQPFLLMNRLGYTATEVPDIVFRATLVQCAAVVFAGLVAGWLSDLTRRRKPFVIGAALACAAGSWMIAGAPSFNAFLAGIAVFGLGLGAYLSVDLALITDVLPNREADAAKDLGVFNVASTLAQVVAPASAWAILVNFESAGGGGYAAVFIAAGIVALLAAIAILPVRSVR